MPAASDWSGIGKSRIPFSIPRAEPGFAPSFFVRMISSTKKEGGKADMQKTGKAYGYVRVSTRDQNEERQLIAMREYGLADSCLLYTSRCV